MLSKQEQLESTEWDYFKRKYLHERDGVSCEVCDSSTQLDIYLREKHTHIEFIWNYPKSSFGIICNGCAYKRKKKISEVMHTINSLSYSSLDTLLDTFDVIYSLDCNQEVAFERLFVSAKQIRR